MTSSSTTSSVVRRSKTTSSISGLFGDSSHSFDLVRCSLPSCSLSLSLSEPRLGNEKKKNLKIFIIWRPSRLWFLIELGPFDTSPQFDHSSPTYLVSILPRLPLALSFTSCITPLSPHLPLSGRSLIHHPCKYYKPNPFFQSNVAVFTKNKASARILANLFQKKKSNRSTRSQLEHPPNTALLTVGYCFAQIFFSKKLQQRPITVLQSFET